MTERLSFQETTNRLRARENIISNHRRESLKSYVYVYISTFIIISVNFQASRYSKLSPRGWVDPVHDIIRF